MSAAEFKANGGLLAHSGKFGFHIPFHSDELQAERHRGNIPQATQALNEGPAGAEGPQIS